MFSCSTSHLPHISRVGAGINAANCSPCRGSYVGLVVFCVYAGFRWDGFYTPLSQIPLYSSMLEFEVNMEKSEPVIPHDSSYVDLR